MQCSLREKSKVSERAGKKFIYFPCFLYTIMKAIIFSDLHGDFNNLEKLQNLRNLFFLGDIFTNKDFVRLIGKDFLDFYFKKIDAKTLYLKFSIVKEKLSQSKMEISIPNFFKQNGMYLLPGNHETKEYYESLKKLPNLHDLHLKKMQISGTEFIGHGGMISPDDRMNLDNFFIYSDEQVAQNLKNLNPSKDCVILMHELPIGNYCSKTRRIIEKIKPKIVIGGHNHKLSKKQFKINGITYLASGMKGDFIEVYI